MNKTIKLASALCTVLLCFSACNSKIETTEAEKPESVSEIETVSYSSSEKHTVTEKEEPSTGTIEPDEDRIPEETQPDGTTDDTSEITSEVQNIPPDPISSESAKEPSETTENATNKKAPETTTALEEMTKPSVTETTASQTSFSPETETAPPPETSGETSLPFEPLPSEKYTQADFDRIIAEVVAYAEGYQEKGFLFEWKEDMEFGWDIGYFGTPRIQYEGVDGVIHSLKFHVDRIVQTSTNPSYGITTSYMTYKVVQITVDGDVAFAVIYGG